MRKTSVESAHRPIGAKVATPSRRSSDVNVQIVDNGEELEEMVQGQQQQLESARHTKPTATHSVRG